MELPRGYLSYSQIQTWLRCPEVYRLRYIEGIVMPPRDVMYQGAVLHSVLATYYRTKMDGRDLAPSDVDDLLVSRFEKGYFDEAALERGERKEVGPETVVWESPPEAVLDEGRAMLRAYLDTIGVRTTPVAVETSLEADVDGIPVKGRVDLVLASGDLADIKFSGTTAVEDFQAAVYALLGGGPTRFVFHVVRRGKNIRATEVPVEITPADVVLARRVVTGVAAAISAGVFPCNPIGWHHSEKYCPAWERCMGGRDA